MRDFAGAEEYIRQAIEILDEHPEQLCNAIDTLSRLREDEGKTEEALAAAPPADRDLTNLPESLKALEQQLASSLERVRALERAI
jgi:hypothetical protein